MKNSAINTYKKPTLCEVEVHTILSCSQPFSDFKKRIACNMRKIKVKIDKYSQHCMQYWILVTYDFDEQGVTH